MNNSFISNQNVSLAEDENQVNVPALRAKETELMAIIDAATKLAGNQDWLILKEKIFDGVVSALETRIKLEVNTRGEKALNGPKIHFLNGQLEWAKKYSNIVEILPVYKQELLNVRKVIDVEIRKTTTG